MKAMKAMYVGNTIPELYEREGMATPDDQVYDYESLYFDAFWFMPFDHRFSDDGQPWPVSGDDLSFDWDG